MTALNPATLLATLQRIWSQVLELPVDRIGPRDNFFALGGDSQLLLRVMSEVNELYFPDEQGLPVAQFFACGTLAELADRLLAAKQSHPQAHAAALTHDDRAIAIIGMAGRFPGADHIPAFWRNLCEGREGMRPLSTGELREAGVAASDLADPRYVRRAPALQDPRLFDYGYFGLTPKEAAGTSPEQRWLLECAEEALQGAGYGERWQGERIGVFCGSGVSSYFLRNLWPLVRSPESAEAMRLIAGGTSPATRVSYLLNLTGPSLTIDTACSSSLVAVHHAMQALAAGECDLELAGGATVRHLASQGYLAESGGIFSADGHCRPFAEQAQGTIGSGGAGFVLLRPLRPAIEERDPILAVILGSAVNNDGRQKLAYTAPGLAGQVDVIRRAHAAAGVNPADIRFIETHGTATPLGDAIEIAALAQVFADSRDGAGRCALGTLKANVGHLEAAAGIAALIKSVLVLMHRTIPPCIHSFPTHPQLALERTRFFFNEQLQSWPPGDAPARAGVSAFGIGGTNAHVVLEQPPPSSPDPVESAPDLMLVSARSESAFRRICDELASYLTDNPSTRLCDVAHTLRIGRTAHVYRRAAVCVDLAEATSQLRHWANDAAPPAPVSTGSPIVFLFPGQGSQHARMAAGLYAREGVFREHLDQCAEALLRPLGLDIRSLVLGGTSPDDERAIKMALARTEISQPALFAVEYALGRLWLSYGVQPSLFIGHSVGEYAAACLAGVFSLDDALRILVTRGRLTQRTAPGRMLAVRLGRHEITGLLGPRVSLAAVNGPNSCVLSGEASALEEVRRKLDARDITAQVVNDTHGFHSELMQEVMEEFGDFLRTVTFSPARIPLVSTLHGRLVAPGTLAEPAYWLSQLRNAVEFDSAVRCAFEGSSKIFLELGPGTILSALVRAQRDADRHLIVNGCRSARTEAPDHSAFLAALGQLWARGAPIHWPAARFAAGARRVPLPTHPFERVRCWVDPPKSEPGPAAEKPPSREPPENWLYAPVWVERSASARPIRLGIEPSAGPIERCCLVFVEAGSDGERVERIARALSKRVVRVRPGNAFARQNDTYELGAARALDYRALLEDLRTRALRVDRVLFAWEGVEGGLIAIMHLCQALEQQTAEPIRLTLLTQETYRVLGTEPVDPMGALVSATAQTLAREYRHIRCHSLDLPGSFDPAEVARHLHAMDDSGCEPPSPIMAWRGHSPWERTFERVPWSPGAAPVLLRDRGVYLISGGLGGIGLTLAGYLARSVRARLILLSRSASEQALGRVQELRDAGADIEIMRADVTSERDVREVIGSLKSRFGALQGVIHAAGVPGGGTIALRTAEAVRQVIAPKVEGTRVLYEAVQPMRPDFLMLCSSIAAILGPAGQFDYCAANAFQDAFAHAFDQPDGMRVLSINWDGWRESGMAVRAQSGGNRAAWREALDSALSGDEGAEVFARVLSSPRPQWLVSTRPFAEVTAASSAAQSGTGGTSIAPDFPGARAAVDAHPTETDIAALWSELLGVPIGGSDTDFFAAGGDSLLAVELGTRISGRFGRAIAVRDLISNPTLASMTRLIGLHCVQQL